MTKAELIEAVLASLPNSSKQDAAHLVDVTIEEIKQQLEAGEPVKISGFGKFDVREKHTRKGRNPQTGEEIAISARRVVTFKPSPVLRESMPD